MKKNYRLSQRIFRGLVKAYAYTAYRPKVIYEDKTALKTEKPLIFVCNHTSHYDGPLVGSVLSTKKPLPLIAKDWCEKKFLGGLFRCYGCVSVNRFEMDTKWFFEAQKQIENGHSFLIFPEGHTSKGDMNEFQPGFAVLADKTECDVVPCAVYGKYKFFGRRMRVYIGSPLSVKCPENLRRSLYAKKVAAEVKEKIENYKRILGGNAA